MNKKLRHKQQYARAVVAAGRLNLDGITRRIRARVGVGVSGLDDDAMNTHLSGLFTMLEQIAANYKVACDNVATDTAQDIRARDDRDTAEVSLTTILTVGRRRIRENLGEDSLRIYGLDDSVPRNDDGLNNYTSQAVALLGDNPQKVTDVLGGEFSTEALRAAVKLNYQAFSDAMDSVDREKQETSAARIKRDEMEVLFGTMLRNIANVLVGHLRMAGLDALAERIRPTVARTSGETEVEVPEQPDPEPEETEETDEHPRS
jgi:hypothetical protein